jgi:hypothetical protein
VNRIIAPALIVLLAAVLALAIASRADSKPRTSSATYRADCGIAWKAVRFYRDKTAQHREKLSASELPPVEENASCRRLRERARYWRLNARTHAKVVEKRTLTHTTNWTRAMRLAQRPFPGTYGWLESISGRECRACYTTSAFICNYQGSGACGPMQFMSGTFYGYAPAAKRWLDTRGFITESRTWVWSSQLGQALTAAYMRYTGRDGCHWCL